jgi:hypothetical protein
LQAVTEGRLRNLIINVPPGHAKSLRAGVFWPAWVWIDRPQTRWLFASYAANLSVRDSLKCRRLIESEWYQQNWGHRYQLTSDQNQKHRFENDHTGYRIATSVGGSATGEKGGCGGSRRPTQCGSGRIGCRTAHGGGVVQRHHVNSLERFRQRPQDRLVLSYPKAWPSPVCSCDSAGRAALRGRLELAGARLRRQRADSALQNCEKCP